MIHYSTFVPDLRLQPFVECCWIVEGFDLTQQKIIPDGFCELIFHFYDPYQITDHKNSHVQPFSIVAGQLNNPISLKPIGRSGVLGVKFKPTGMWKLLGCDMNELTNQTIFLDSVIQERSFVAEQLHDCNNNIERIRIVESFLLTRLESAKRANETDSLVEQINRDKGKSSIKKLADENKISLRKVERIFTQQVGVSAKLYSRLIRFKHVLRLLQQENLPRTEITYLSGYFDQAHFNKEFKEFSGENPESWIKQNHSFANFFLSR